MALPDYGEPMPVTPEIDDYVNAAGAGSWGAIKLAYVDQAVGELTIDDTVRQRFESNVVQRREVATARVIRYTPLASDVFPDATYQSVMSDKDAARIVCAALGKPIDYLGSGYVTYAVQQLGSGHALYARWKGCVNQCLAGEAEIRDTAMDYLSTLSVAP